MPGSPPTRIAEPGTSPPPHTRSNSAMPVSRRGGRVLSPRQADEIERAPPRPASAPRLFGGAVARHLLDQAVPGAAASQRPVHFGMDRAALLADKAGLGGHPFSLASAHRSPHLHLDRPLGAAVDELVDIGVAGMVDLGGRAVPDDAALVQHRDAVGDLARADHVVGDRDRGGAELAHAFDDQLVDHVGHDRVEPGGRLVEEDDLGLGGDGAGERHALLHAARQLGRAAARRLRARARPRRASASAISLRRVPRHAAPLDQAEGDVLPDAQRVEQGAALEQHAEFAASAARGRARRSPTVSSPSMRIEPASGRSRPRMHLISTDLPVPEPPMMTRLSPAPQSMSTPSSTRLRPERLAQPRGRRSSATPGASLIARRTPRSAGS